MIGHSGRLASFHAKLLIYINNAGRTTHFQNIAGAVQALTSSPIVEPLHAPISAVEKCLETRETRHSFLDFALASCYPRLS